jgi:hypothetical protein
MTGYVPARTKVGERRPRQKATPGSDQPLTLLTVVAQTNSLVLRGAMTKSVIMTQKKKRIWQAPPMISRKTRILLANI